MVTTSGHRFVLATVFAACFVALASTAARAQSSIGFTGGGSIDPEQVYAGVYWESPALGGSFRLRPGLDGGFGDNLRLGTFNIDLIVKFPLGQTGWSLVQGGGPVISVTRFTGEFEDYEQELHAGGSYLFGFQHDKGFFTEFRVGGGGYTPQLKIGVGWAIEMK